MSARRRERCRAARSGAYWSRNQSRCWANERGKGWSRETGTSGAGTGPDTARRRSKVSARDTTLDASNIHRSGSSTPHVWRILEATARGQQRVAAQVEEIVVDSHPLELQYFRPDGRQLFLHRRPGSHVPRLQLRTITSRRRQGFPVDLPVGSERQTVQNHEGRGNHVLGQSPAQEAPQLGRRGCYRGIGWHHVGHQSLVSRLVLPRDHNAPPQTRMSGEARFDLSKLDAKAPNLDLLVESAQVFQVPVSHPSHLVARPVQPGFRLVAEGIRNEPFGGQLRPIEITSRQPRAANVQLARHPHGNRLEMMVQNKNPRIRDGTTYCLGTVDCAEGVC